MHLIKGWRKAAKVAAMICAFTVVSVTLMFELKYGTTSGYRQVHVPFNWSSFERVAALDPPEEHVKVHTAAQAFPLGDFWVCFDRAEHASDIGERVVSALMRDQTTTYRSIAHLRIGQSVDDMKALPISDFPSRDRSSLGPLALRRDATGGILVLTERSSLNVPESAIFAFTDTPQRKWAPLPILPYIAWAILTLVGGYALFVAGRTARARTDASADSIDRKVATLSQLATVTLALATIALAGLFVT